MLRSCILLCCWCWCVVGSSAELETILGDKLSGEIQSISAAGVVSGSGLERTVRLSELRSILLRQASASSEDVKILAQGTSGARYHWQSVRFNGDEFIGTLPAGVELPVPFDGLKSLRFDTRNTVPAFEDALAKPSADSDKIFLLVEKQYETISGLLAAIDDKQIQVEVAGEKKTLPREKVYGVVLAQAGTSAPAPIMLQLENGSRVAAVSVEFQAETWKVKLASGKVVEFHGSSVVGLEFRPAGLKYLSELEPLSVREESLYVSPAPFVKVGPNLSWKRDRNVRGGNLKLAGRIYERGLGVHALCELTYAVPAGSKWFLASAGIDDAASSLHNHVSQASLGDCELRILGDGRELFQARVKSGETPAAIRVDVTGVKQLTLLAEPGANQDFADHVNWCDARFLPAVTAGE